MKRMQFHVWWLGLMVTLVAATSHAVPNPAAAYAEKLGYAYAANAAGGTVTMPDGTVLGAWDFFRGKVGSEYAYGAQYGYDTVNRRVETNGYVQSFAVCVPKDPLKKGTPEEIPLLDLMRLNGEPLWDYTRGATPPAVETILETAPLKTFPKQALPSSYDSRNVGGLSYIGAIRNQGSCGSCYSFGAAAAAEGSFNVAMNRTGSQCVDFSEAYIAWCLGTYGAYSDHFSGCDGADYEYAELEALTVEGICGENQMPYNSGSDPGYCTYSGTTTVFESWARVPSGDIDAIKTAIMTYGVVDAAVLTDTAFMNYDTGVYDNNNNDCNSGYYETTDHAISLVGWDDDPPEGGGGVFILRNSWGTSGTGEGGYMRIRTNAAVVHCAVCYVVYGEAAETAPSFTSGTSFGATTGVARTHTVTASGNPAPALKLRSTTASAGYYAFATNTGVLTYQPPAADAGSKTFTFTASNSLGVATQTVTATVTLAPPAAPAAIWASATNTTDFTAAWSSVADATGYRLDVGTNATFTGGGSGAAADLFISEYVEGSSNNKAIEIFNGTGSSVDLGAGGYTLRMYANGGTSPTTITLSGTVANNDVFVVANSSANAAILAAADMTSGSLSHNGNDVLALAKNSSNVDVVGTIGSSAVFGEDVTKVRLGSVSEGTTTYATGEWTDYAVDTTSYLGSHTFTGGGDPSFVPGYSNRTVASTSQSVTGLTAGATYYFRARAVNAGGSSPNTSVASVTTLATLSAPVFGANPGPVAATAGVQKVFTVGASGVPAPTLALTGQTASGGYSFNAGTGELTYTPPQADAGARTFAFSATNSQGTASQVVTVNVAAATAPTFTGGAGPFSTTVGVEVAFTVTASGTAPTLALQSQTASSGYSFTPATGAFTYTPPAGDVGTRTFTFTAANAAGTVTQVTSVAVAAVPTAPDAPAAVWASATNATDFTAAWSASDGATGYRLDVGTNATFSAGGGSVNLMSNAGFESGDSTSWTKFETEYAVVTTDPQEGTYHVSCAATGTRDLMQPVAITGDGTTEYEVSFWYKKPASGNARIWATWASGGQVSGDDLTPDVTYLPVAADWTKVTYAVVPQSGANVLNFEVRTYSGATVYWDNFFVGTSGGGSTPSYVPGYSNRTVAGTSQSVTGLVAESTYYFRVRAVNAVGASGDSSVANVTTLVESVPGTPPTMAAIPAQIANVGSLFDYTATATATDGDPILAYACSSAVDTNVWDFDVNTGYFVFEPTAAQLGTNLFDFTATDKDGASAPAQMSVRVYSAAASNEFTQWVEDQEEDPVDPDFAEGADVDGDGQTTYEEYLADTDPAASNSVLRLEGQTADLTEFSFPASPARYYQLEYCTDITNQAGTLVVSNLGWGVPGMVITNDLPDSWFGTIRVLLDEP